MFGTSTQNSLFKAWYYLSQEENTEEVEEAQNALQAAINLVIAQQAQEEQENLPQHNQNTKK